MEPNFKTNQRIIIYDDKNIHYTEADVISYVIQRNNEYYETTDGMLKSIPTDITYSFTTANGLDSETIKLDDTLMKRIAKYNKTRELQQIEKQIKEKQEKIKELDELLQDKQKRWKKVKDYIANIYELDLDEDNEDEYYYDD